jgi:hypothetical protein
VADIVSSQRDPIFSPAMLTALYSISLILDTCNVLLELVEKWGIRVLVDEERDQVGREAGQEARAPHHGGGRH